MSVLHDSYEKVRVKWGNLITQPVQEMRRWQYSFAFVLVVNMILVFGLIKVSLKSTVTTWVVEVDETGRAVVSGKANNVNITDNRIIRAYLYSFIEKTRSVVSDVQVMRKNLDLSYQMSSSSTKNFLNEYYRQNNPFEKVKIFSVQIVPTAFLKESQHSFIVEWKEINRDLSSKILREEYFKALITINQATLKSEKELMDNPMNPFGIVIKNISWSKIL